MPKDQLSQWVESKKKLMAGSTPAERARFLEVRGRLIKALHAGGAGLLLGSDGPQVWNVPGFSVHRELRYLVQAGLTPYQALETGTRNVAVFFGTSADRARSRRASARTSFCSRETRSQTSVTVRRLARSCSADGC